MKIFIRRNVISVDINQPLQLSFSDSLIEILNAPYYLQHNDLFSPCTFKRFLQVRSLLIKRLFEPSKLRLKSVELPRPCWYLNGSRAATAFSFCRFYSCRQ